MWSYEKLDPRHQRCFLYCSLFPKGHKYSVEELLYLWIAEGLVDSRNQDKRMDDIGREYINEMVSCSFFQTSESLYGTRLYAVHDLLHDLAEELSREDCFRLEDDNVTKIPCAILTFICSCREYEEAQSKYLQDPKFTHCYLHRPPCR